MKHRIFGLLICCFLALSISVSADAEDLTAYTLDEPGLTVSLPSDYTVLTRDIDEDDPALIGNVWTKTDWLEFMTAQSVYLAGWDENINHGVLITVEDTSLEDFNVCSDTELTDMAASMVTEYEDDDLTLTKYELYRHAQTKFMKIYFNEPYGDGTEYCLRYYTVYNGKAINIFMYSYSGQISLSIEVTMRCIVDSVVFEGAPQAAEADYTPTSAFTYTDPDTGVTFTVPENWVESPLTETDKFIDVKFTSRDNEAMCILYGSYDLWTAMSEESEESVSGYDRSDFDNSIFAKSGVAKAYGISDDDVVMVTYGGHEYFEATIPATATGDGLETTTTVTRIISVDNGYVYTFRFSGTSGDACYADFEVLLNSVTFESRGVAASGENAGLEDTGDENTGDAASTRGFRQGKLLLMLLAAFAAYFLPIVIYRYAIRKAPVAPRKALNITIYYGIFALLVIAVLGVILRNGIGAATLVLVWSYVNYYILVGKRAHADADIRPDAPEENAPAAQAPVFQPEAAADETAIDGGAQSAGMDETPADAAQTQTGDDIPEIKYCYKCGNKLQPNSLFCDKCGTKIPETAGHAYDGCGTQAAAQKEGESR
ncbi:MAG: zinc ribbon domain-containing protein [Oscillospiraceae bacterium]